MLARLSVAESFDIGIWHHFLGFFTVRELAACVNFVPDSMVSFDTMKPFATAYYHLSNAWIEGRGKLERPPLDIPYNPLVAALFKENVRKLKDAIDRNIVSI
jgi:hypothetical protein